MTNRALFDLDDDGENQIFVAAHGVTVTVTLRVPATASSWMLQVWDPDQYDPTQNVMSNPPRASKAAPLLELTGTTTGQVVAAEAPSQEITIETPATGTHSYIIRSVVDGGMTNGAIDRDKIWERGLVVIQGSIRKPPITETTQFENDSWAGLICDLVDLLNAAPIGSAYTTVQENGVSKPQSTTINFIGATVTTVSGVTTVTISGGSSLSPGSAAGQPLIWNGSAWGGAALDLADADARTGTLPAANGGTGIAGAGGTPNRVLATTDGSLWTAGLVALATMVSGLLPIANLADGSATSVLGRAANSVGVQASIAASADGQVLRRGSGAIAFGAVDLADGDAITGTLPAGNGGTGIAGAGGTANRVLVTTDGTAWSAGLVDLASMVTGTLPFSALPNGSANSVFGRSAGTAGVQASIASSADGQVLVRAAGAVAFGAVDLADGDAVTGLLPFANLASLAGLSVFGRSANTTGVMAAITGTTDQVLRISTAGTVLGFGTIATGGITDAAVTLAKLANGTASSVLGRSAATVGAYADITSSADGQVLRRGASGVIAFGAVDLADADAVTGLLPFANVAAGSALSVFGRAGATSGVQASIAGTADQVLRVNGAGTVLGFGAIGTAGITDSAVTLAKLSNGTAASVLGRSAATTGVYADIASSADGQVLVRAAGAVAFGAVDLADADAVTGLLPFANVASGSATSVFGRAGGTGGAMASIAASADGQLLQRLGGVVTFSTLSVGTIAGGSAVGQVLINASGNIPTWGAVDLADSDAVTGVLPFANLATIVGLSVLGRAVNTTGPLAAITGADGQVLRVAGTTLAFGALVTAGYTDGSITLAKLANGTASSVLGRSAATVGAYADITSSADGQVLRRGASGVIAFGAVDLADADAVTGLLPFSNVVSVATATLLGRVTAGTGSLESITLNATLSFSAGTLQREALTGDVTAAAGSNTTAIAANVIVDADINTAAAIAVSKLANATASSVLGRSAATSGAYADIPSSADGQVLRRGASGVVGFGAVDLADSDAVTGVLPLANIANGSALSVFGRSAATSGAQASIAGTADQVLRVDSAGTTLGFGTIATGGIANSAVTLAKLSNGTAASVLGRSAATTGVYADIASSADGQVLVRAAGAVAFGAVDLADGDAVTGLLPFANLASLAGLSVFGRSANTTGVMAAITGTDGQVLRVSGTTLGFGTILATGITDGTVTLAKLANGGAASVLGRSAGTSGVYADISSSADGQTLRRAAGVLAWGALDLADVDAVTGLLPGTNVNPNFGSQTVITTGTYRSGTNPSTGGAYNLANATEIQGRNAANTANQTMLRIDSSNTVSAGDVAATGIRMTTGGTIGFRVAGADVATLDGSLFTMLKNHIAFDGALSTCLVNVGSSAVAAATGTTLEFAGQDMVGTGATIGGTTFVRGGSGDTGGIVDIRSGAGSTSIKAGTFIARVGSTVFMNMPGTSQIATTGHFRMPTSGSVTGRNVANNGDLGFIRSNSGDFFFIAEGSTGASLCDGKLNIAGSVIEIGVPDLHFDSTMVSPFIYQELDSTAGVTGDTFFIQAQNVTGTGATVGGLLTMRGGASTNGTGGGVELRSGTGVTGASDGAVRLYTGSNLRMFLSGTGDFNFQDNALITTSAVILGTAPSTAGQIRVPHNVSALMGRNNANNANRNLIRWGVTANDTLVVGDTSNISTDINGSSINILSGGALLQLDANGIMKLTNGLGSPAGNPSSGVYFYCINGEVWVRGGAGTITKLAEA